MCVCVCASVYVCVYNACVLVHVCASVNAQEKMVKVHLHNGYWDTGIRVCKLSIQ